MKHIKQLTTILAAAVFLSVNSYGSILGADIGLTTEVTVPADVAALETTVGSNTVEIAVETALRIDGDVGLQAQVTDLAFIDEIEARGVLDLARLVPAPSYDDWMIPSTGGRAARWNYNYRLYNGGVPSNVVFWTDCAGDVEDLSSHLFGGYMQRPDDRMVQNAGWIFGFPGHASEAHVPASPGWKTIYTNDFLVSVRMRTRFNTALISAVDSGWGTGGFTIDQTTSNVRGIVKGASGTNIIADFGNIETNAWKIVTLHWDQSTKRANIYIDGVWRDGSAATDPAGLMPFDADTDLIIGGNATSDLYGFDGDISGLVVFRGGTNDLDFVEDLHYMDDAYHQTVLWGQSLATGNAALTNLYGGEPSVYMFDDILLPTDLSSLNRMSDATTQNPVISIANTICWPGRRVIGGAAAVGAKKYVDLKRGTSTYTNLMAQFDAGRVLASSEGREWMPEFLCVMHGESDEVAQTTEHQYIAYLRELITNVREDCANIGARTLPVMITTESAAWHTVSIPKTEPICSLGLWKASLVDDRIFCATPNYIFPVQDNIHPDNYGSAKCGEYIGKAANSILSTGEWKPLQPISAELIGSNVVMQFDVPVEPLQLSTNIVVDPGNYGFVYYDSDGIEIVSGVEVTGPTEVTITLPQVPTGDDKAIRYAYYGVIGNDAGPEEGPRGCLHDSDPYPSIYNSEPLNNYCVAFDWSL